MDKKLQYVLVVIIVLAILYLLYKNSSESYNSCSQKQDVKESIVPKTTTYKIAKSDDNKSKSQKTLVVHHTTWCGYSKRFNQQMKQGLEDKLNKVNVNVEYVDCEEEPEKCVSAGVRGYPTLILYTDKGKTVYQGDRSDEHLTTFCLQH
jgi:thiol-disulfide isomerase/thioredoxin